VVNSHIPAEFNISQNYPNPFNPYTFIQYSIAKAGFVKLVVYDNLGREIETLVNERVTPGIYEAKWDASEMPSGVYL
jgi:hypothetical protein